MKTRIHLYRFETSSPAGEKAWLEFKAKMQAAGLHRHKSWSETSHHTSVADIDGQEIELETTHLFSNQWNTGPIAGKSENGLRVFDWAQDYKFNSRFLKEGYYLDQTEEMRAIRENTFTCGYCGKHSTDKAQAFCNECLGSEYLKSTELHLLRMLPVALNMPKREPLTDAERATLLPLYSTAQLHGRGERSNHYFTTTRAKIEREYKNETAKAKTEHDGKIWCVDRRISIENLIYYSHTGRFCFGWIDNGIDKEFESTLLDAISEFPFPYEIKCADGRVLSGTIE